MYITAIILYVSFVSFSSHLTYFSQWSHIDTYGFGSFISTSVYYFIRWIHHNLFVISFTEGHLSCFCFASLSRTAMNTLVLFWTIFGVHTQEQKAGSIGQMHFQLDWQTALYSDWTNLCSRHQHLYKTSCLTTSLPTSALVRLYFCQSDGCEVVSHLNLHSLSMRSSVLCSLAIWVSSRQITYVRILGCLLQLLIQVTESPTRRCLSQKRISLFHTTSPTVG